MVSAYVGVIAMLPGFDASPTPPPSTDILDRLARCLAHNLNNRLTGVIGYLELALQEPGIPAPASRHLRTSLDCALDVVRMLRRVVTFAVRSSPPPPQLFSPATLLEQSASRLGQTVRHLSLHVIAETRAQIIIEPRALQLALEQLIDNAIDAMPHTGALTLRLWEDHHDLCLSVGDTGSGLSPFAQSHLFEPFISTRPAGHLGLGLALSHSLVQTLRGTLTLECEPGKGTTATIRLPNVLTPSSEQETLSEAVPRLAGVRVDTASSPPPLHRRSETAQGKAVTDPHW